MSPRASRDTHAICIHFVTDALTTLFLSRRHRPTYVYLADSGASNLVTGSVLAINGGSYFCS